MSERNSNEMENLSLRANSRFPRDLLQRFMVGTTSDPRRSDPEDEDSGLGEVELNLGLSLGGRFGVDKSNSKLMRSSSIASVLPVVRDDDVLGGGQKTGPGGSYSGLVRTSSLPVETEEEWRKRKELQSLRRLAAKRRRSEKQRNLTKGEREEYVAAMGRVGSSAGPPLGSGNWVSGSAPKPAGLVVGSGATAEGLIGKGKGNSVGGGATSTAGGAQFTQPSSQGSVESQAGSGSSMSEFESRHLQGSSSGGEASPVSMQSVQERSNQDATGSSRLRALDPAGRPAGPETENPSKSRGKEIGLNSVEDMPCVFTQGDGPNGRRIEGILYKYGKGEEVKIMCVCHGSFLSPAEFVKHAGRTDVVHPLKHIVVNPNPPSFL